jgi:hypothetical protein
LPDIAQKRTRAGLLYGTGLEKNKSMVVWTLY